MSGSSAIFQVPKPFNEPIYPYAPGDARRDSLQKCLKSMASEKVEIPLVIGGKEIRTGKTRKVVMPHDHGHVLGEFHLAGPEEMRMAVDASVKAQWEWESLSWENRTSVLLRAAELLAGPWRDRANAATMLGQSKNVFQAEIDAACELIDFFRFNCHYYEEILKQQPISSQACWNRVEYRPLEGFVLAITPFNFSSIAGNLPTAPALCGNSVVWKPSSTQMLSAYYTMKLFEEAGFPPGVINLIGAAGSDVGATLFPHERLSGVHFTGSTGTFQKIYRAVGREHREV